MHAFLKGVKPSTSNGTKTKNDESSQKEKKLRPIPWVEKYRPKCIEDVAYQDDVVAVLKKTLTGADFPNLLFYGPPGTGKTSTILAASRELFGDMYKDRILELNSSDERGIQVIRDKVKTFSQRSASGKRPDGIPCPPFKIVILDEADSMTNAAQAALRRTMEKESRTTRFCLICNYVSRIIKPITSRCSKFRFKPLASNILSKRLEEICAKENIKYDEDVIKALIDTSEGDMRKAITSLQSGFRLKGSDGICASDIFEMNGIIPKNVMQKLYEVCSSDSYEKLEAFVQDLITEGYSAGQFINQVHDTIVTSLEYSDNQKSVITEKLAICDKRLQDGADEYLQILDVSTTIMNQICHNK
ncbi:Replication factor C subunit 4 [Nymphon striatum]|nr:Replication factor C subunit 4 [Nymphon striatum]